MLLKNKSEYRYTHKCRIRRILACVAMALALTFALCGCAPDDIDISNYADQQIAIEGVSDTSVNVSIQDLKNMECISVKTESTSDKIGKVKATGPTLETVLAQQGIALDSIRKITFHGKDQYVYSLQQDYIMEHDIILAFGIDGEPLDEEDAPCRIIIPESDSAYWLRMLDKITIEMK